MAPGPSIPATPVPTPPPVAPVPPPLPPTLAFVWVVVLENSSAICVRNAVVEIVAGQGLGRRVSQKTPCDYWDPDHGAIFEDLIVGQEVTLRASAPGYTPTEQTVIPTTGGQYAVWFELSPIK